MEQLLIWLQKIIQQHWDPKQRAGMQVKLTDATPSHGMSTTFDI